MSPGEMDELRYLVVWWIRHHDWQKHAIYKAAACEGKGRFPSFNEARHSITRRLERFTHVYRCDACGLWHVGHRKTEGREMKTVGGA